VSRTTEGGKRKDWYIDIYYRINMSKKESNDDKEEKDGGEEEKVKMSKVEKHLCFSVTQRNLF